MLKTSLPYLFLVWIVISFILTVWFFGLPNPVIEFSIPIEVTSSPKAISSLFPEMWESRYHPYKRAIADILRIPPRLEYYWFCLENHGVPVDVEQNNKPVPPEYIKSDLSKVGELTVSVSSHNRKVAEIKTDPSQRTKCEPLDSATNYSFVFEEAFTDFSEPPISKGVIDHHTSRLYGQRKTNAWFLQFGKIISFYSYIANLLH